MYMTKDTDERTLANTDRQKGNEPAICEGSKYREATRTGSSLVTCHQYTAPCSPIRSCPWTGGSVRDPGP